MPIADREEETSQEKVYQAMWFAVGVLTALRDRAPPQGRSAVDAAMNRLKEASTILVARGLDTGGRDA